MIHEQLPLPVPCYDFVLITDLTVEPRKRDASGITGSPDMTGGEYKLQEHIHGTVADMPLLAIPTS